MTILDMMYTLEDYGDATIEEYTTDEDTVYNVTLKDFAGFDDEWNMVCREYVRDDLVEMFLNALDEQALRFNGILYYTYYFDGFRIRLGYSSYDI